MTAMAPVAMNLDAALGHAAQQLLRGELAPLDRPAPPAMGTADRDAPWPLSPGGGGDDADEPSMARDRPRFRAIFISDIHLGTPGCQACRGGCRI